MNTSNYFPHNNNARNDEKIIGVRMDYGCEGYGIYFMLLERLSESSDNTCIANYKVLSYEFQCDAETVKAIVENYGLFTFTEDGKRFYSPSFNERTLKKLEIKGNVSPELSAIRAEAGRKGAAKKWQNMANNGKNIANDNKDIANADLPLLPSDLPIANAKEKGHKRKEKIKEKGDIKGTDVPTSDKPDERQLSIPVESDESESVDEEKTGKEKAPKESINWANLVTNWNKITAGSFPPITSIENKRRQMAAARISEYGKDAFMQAIRRAVQSDFLRGQNARGFILNFDWLIRPNNFPKVLEGNYDNTTTRSPQTPNNNGTVTATKQRNPKFADFSETLAAIDAGINAGITERGISPVGK